MSDNASIESTGPTPPERPPPEIGRSLYDDEYESVEENPYWSPGLVSESEGSSSGDERLSRDGSPFGQLCRLLMSDYKDSVFACGGSIPIGSDGEAQGKAHLGHGTDDEAGSTAASDTLDSPSISSSSTSPGSITVPSAAPHPSITLRWDPCDASTPAGYCKLTLPEESASANLDRLVADMKPATFGRGGEDVYDETYRKALKMDVDGFTTNFCPYSVGIIDAVSQILLPNPNTNRHRAIKAELYKLNIYTGPSGHFRAHVDTPRSLYQFGSLVVCLPVKHEGGALEVRHGEHATAFDWASGMDGGDAQIQWAAFYSDCEHEVFPVHSGHRITLTYNLYVTRGLGQISNSPNASDVSQMPFHRALEALVDDVTWMSDGGYLGFYTTHTYPHTSSTGCLTDTLKGLDMALWQAFQRLGCGVCLRPILINDWRGEKRLETLQIGKAFNVKTSSIQVDTDDFYDQVIVDTCGLERISWGDVVWLNEHDVRNRQVSHAYVTYGNEAYSRLAYSVCAIIVGVPKVKDGERMAMKTTFTMEEEDLELYSPVSDDEAQFRKDW